MKIRDICAKAGVSIGIFYHYYQTKENILNESLGYGQFDDFIKERWASYERGTPRDNIRFLIRLQLETTVKMGWQAAAFFYKHQLDNEEKQELEEKRFFYHRVLFETEQEVDSGGFTGDSAVIAEDVMRSSRGVIYNWCIDAGRHDLLAEGQKFLQMVFDYYDGNGHKPRG